MGLFKTDNCPICGGKTNAMQKTMGKYNGKYICRDCFTKIMKIGINFTEIKKKSLDELQSMAGVQSSITEDEMKPVKEEKKLEKNERLNKEVKCKSKRFFSKVEYDSILKYSYYDVEIKGAEYYNVKFEAKLLNKKIQFEFEPNNEYDSGAIIVMSDDIKLGYVPRNNIQKMLTDYLKNPDNSVIGYISEIDSTNKSLKMALGFYSELSENELEEFSHIDVSLTKTSKKDDFGISRQENLEMLSEGESVSIEYDFDYEKDQGTFIVTNMGEELGEISAKQTEKLVEYEKNGKSFICIVNKLNYSDSEKVQCKVRIYIVD